MYKNKWESLITFPFVLFGGERGINFRHLCYFSNLLRINTLYRLFYVVSTIYYNNYIVLIDCKNRQFFLFYQTIFQLFSVIPFKFCNFAPDECVSPSLKSPKSLLGEYEAQTAVHIDGLPICAYLRAFGDA